MTDEEIHALVDEFNRKVSLDPEIRSVMQKIRNQDADFSDTSRMFWRRSELLRNYLQGIVLDLPAGAREQLCTALLNAGYSETNEVMQSVQQALDEPQGIHLNPVLPKRPVERIVQVAHALEDPTVPDDKIVRRAGAPVANVNMSFHDKYIEENARIRAKLGMKPTITRYGSGCCKWCSEVAGRYRFGEQPKDIFRRHDNCDCVIIYDNQVLRGHENEDGGRSKKWEEVKPEDVLAEGFSPKIFSQSEAEELQERLMQYLTKPGQGDIMNLDSIELFTGIGKISENVKANFDKVLEPIPNTLLEQLAGFVSKVTLVDGRGYSSYNPLTHEILLDRNTGASSILHELGHAFGDMLNLYDDPRFLKIIADGLEISNWDNVVPIKHPFVDGEYAYVLSSNAQKILNQYQLRVYADLFSVDMSESIDPKLFREYISETFDAFFSNKELLRSKDPKLYEYLEGIINGYA